MLRINHKNLQIAISFVNVVLSVFMLIFKMRNFVKDRNIIKLAIGRHTATRSLGATEIMELIFIQSCCSTKQLTHTLLGTPLAMYRNKK